MTQPREHHGRRLTGRLGRRHAVAILAAVTAVCGLTPGTAYAHGLGEEVVDRSVAEFVPIGMQHMLLGWDHLLFIAGVVFIAREWRLAAKLITVFVVGHSTTLIIATLAGWQMNATLVDIIIGLSVVFVGVVALRGRPSSWTAFGAAVFVFGLIHGLGLSTRLQAVGLPHDGLLPRVIAFNVGIELGQLTVILALAAVVLLVRKLTADRPHDPEQARKLARWTAIALIAGGVLAVFVVSRDAWSHRDDPEITGVAIAPAPTPSVTPAPAGPSTCTEGPRNVEFPPGGGHPMKSFFEPTELTPMSDFGHMLVVDGYIAFLYNPALPANQVSALRDMVNSPDGSFLAGPGAGQTEPVKVVTATKTLTCTAFNPASVKKFAADALAGKK